MKTILILTLSLAALHSFAGNSQGNFSVINPQNLENFKNFHSDAKIKIIHSTPSINGVSRISVGHLNLNQWQVQTIDIPDDLLLNSDIASEIQKSIDLNDWVEIKN